MLPTVVLGMDFSEPSVNAAHWIRDVIAPDTELVLAHAISAPLPPSFARDLYPDRDAIVAAAERRAADRFQRLTPMLGTASLRTATAIGPADEVLAGVAREHKAGLIVIAIHGENAEFARLLGSTAERLVRRGTTDVLIARGIRRRRERTILLVLDESPSAAAAIEWAGRIAATTGAPIVALFVGVPIVGDLESAGANQHPGPDIEGVRQRTEQWLTTRLADTSLAGSRTEVVFGDRGFEIDAAAQRLDPELVIISRSAGEDSDETNIDAAAEFLVRNGSHALLVVGNAANA